MVMAEMLSMSAGALFAAAVLPACSCADDFPHDHRAGFDLPRLGDRDRERRHRRGRLARHRVDQLAPLNLDARETIRDTCRAMVLIFLLGFPFEWIEICSSSCRSSPPILSKLDFAEHLGNGAFFMAWFGTLVAVNLQTSFARYSRGKRVRPSSSI
jgi:hypothetical protein